MFIATAAGTTYFEATQAGLPEWAAIALSIVATIGITLLKSSSKAQETDTDHR